MPIASFKPDINSPMEVNLPRAEPPDYSSIVVDDHDVPLNSLISYVGGAPWTVQYFAQTLSKHNDLGEHDPERDGVYQQYTKINDLELRVVTPLDSTQDSDTTIVTITGSALVYPFLTPNVGDMFIASVGDNHNGLFRVKERERKNFNRDSVYSIDYDMVCYTDVDPQRVNNLNSKVVKEYYFHKDRLAEGLAPTVLKEEHRHILDLSDLYKKLTAYYFKNFFNKEYSTLILPGQTSSIYDSFLIEYLMKTISTTDAYEFRFVKQLSIENDSYLEQPQFWTALLEGDASILDHCHRRMGLVSARSFGRDASLRGLRYSRLEYVVYPLQPDTSTQSYPGEVAKIPLMNDTVEAPSGVSGMAALLHDFVPMENISLPMVRSVIASDTYLMSESFYNDQPVESVLESLVLDYIKGKAINLELLNKVVRNYRRWGRLEQFYYLPMIFTLIKVTTGRYT